MSSSLVSSAGYRRLTRTAFAGVVALGLASCTSGSSGGLALDDAVPDHVDRHVIPQGCPSRNSPCSGVLSRG